MRKFFIETMQWLQEIDESERNMHKYDLLTEEEKEQLVGIFFEKLKEDRNEKPDADGRYTYRIELQDKRFEGNFTDNQVQTLIEMAIDVVEELKKINDGGFDSRRLTEILKNYEEKENDEFTAILMVAESFITERIQQIIDELCELFQADGAFKFMMLNPFMKSTIFNIFEYSIDRLDESNMYFTVVYFLLRAEMQIGSRPIE